MSGCNREGEALPNQARFDDPKAEQRDPIMTAEHARAMLDTILHNALSNGDSHELATAKANAWAAGMWNASDFYENLITSGELMVVKTARVLCSVDTGWNPICSNCGRIIEGSDIQAGEFCRCGAKIIE